MAPIVFSTAPSLVLPVGLFRQRRLCVVSNSIKTVRIPMALDNHLVRLKTHAMGSQEEKCRVPSMIRSLATTGLISGIDQLL